MAHRGRVGIAEATDRAGLRLVVPMRLKAPPHLPAAARAIWRELVGAFPPDYFRASDRALLACYVCVAANAAEASRILAEEGLTYMLGTRRLQHPAVAVRSSCVASMSTLAVKLRLSASSRMRPDTAKTKADAQPSAKRPWA
jgi:P27 family predicted phage terminase small subunit